MRKVSTAIAATLLLAACVPPGGRAVAQTPAGDDALRQGELGGAKPGMDGCDAAAAEFAVGKPYTDELGEEARAAAGANTVRAIPAGINVAMVFVPGRLTIWLDEAGAVRQVSCS